MSIVQKALESARHELTTLHGLIAADAAAPERTWRIDTKAITDLIDEAFSAETTQQRLKLLKAHLSGEKGSGLAYDHAVERSAGGNARQAIRIVRNDYALLENGSSPERDG